MSSRSSQDTHTPLGSRRYIVYIALRTALQGWLMQSQCMNIRGTMGRPKEKQSSDLIWFCESSRSILSLSFEKPLMRSGGWVPSSLHVQAYVYTHEAKLGRLIKRAKMAHHHQESRMAHTFVCVLRPVSILVRTWLMLILCSFCATAKFSSIVWRA